MNRRPLIVGNWKMYKSASEAALFVRVLQERLAARGGNAGAVPEVVVCPPFTALETVLGEVGMGPVSVGAQNLHWGREGAYTGEVAGPMLADLGCRWVIIGHSERRQYFGETDETVNKKIRAALDSGLGPIACVGESLAERESGQTMAVCRRQVEQGLAGLAGEEAARLVVAYEPVWAIGTGRNARPSDAQEVIAAIRGILARIYGEPVAAMVRILYGGSVKPGNMASLMAETDIDGVLVGGASLDVDSFYRIVNFQE